jgi:hypothetical protein
MSPPTPSTNPYRIPDEGTPADLERNDHMVALQEAGRAADIATKARTTAQAHMVEVIVDAHGPAADGGLSYDEIATHVGRGRVRVRQIVNAARGARGKG